METIQKEKVRAIVTSKVMTGKRRCLVSTGSPSGSQDARFQSSGRKMESFKKPTK